MLRPVNYILVHSTMTRPEVEAERLFKKLISEHERPAFHLIIDRWGKVVRLLGCNVETTRLNSFPVECVHIAYEGGINYNGKTADTRTLLQTYTLYKKLIELRELFPGALVLGADKVGSSQTKPGFNVPAWMQFYAENFEGMVELERGDELEENLYPIWRAAS
ncbi:MAG: hypothetical protein MUC87_03595 [Bacteroidia bacterium]|jgi:hypothetical protein|nr:hypothetical protein [Bacteroidia bacterium]